MSFWKSWLLGVVGLVALGLPTIASAGGWLVATLDEVPTAVVVGQEQTIGFMLRQHGDKPIAGQTVTLEFVHQASGRRLTVRALDDPARAGHYQARVSLPEAGTWTWSIQAWATHPMPPLVVQAAVAQPAPDAPSPSPATPPVAASQPAPSRWPLLAGATGLAGLGVISLALAWWRRGPTRRSRLPATA